MAPFAWISVQPTDPVVFGERTLLIPGIKQTRNGDWLVPYNAVSLFDQKLKEDGGSITKASWGKKPPISVPWDVIEGSLRASKVQPWVLDGFLTQYQKNAISFGWTRTGLAFWHPTGAGKTLTGILTCLSIPGPVLIVTRAVSRIQYAREIERFIRTRAFIFRPAGAPVPQRVRGESWHQFRTRHKGQGFSAADMAEAWEDHKTKYGLDKPKTAQQYLQERKEAGERPFFVIGWETLSSNMDTLRNIQPSVVLFDEAHRGKSTKRNEVIHLAELPDDPNEAARIHAEEEADFKSKGGFIKVTEDGRKGFMPLENIASVAASISRLAQKRIGTTATPVKDRIRDLWAQLDMIEPNAWGSSTAWRTRYCLVPETPILMGDGRYLPIGDVKEGDEVIGWDSSTGKRFLRRTKVVAVGRRMAEVVQLRMESGEVIRCTRDHHWLYSLTTTLQKPYRPTSRWVDREGGRWVRGIDHLLRVGFTPADPRGLDTDAYKMGYIRGLLEGDGHVRITENLYEPHTEWGKARRAARGKKGPPKVYQASVFSVELPHLERALHFSDEMGMESTGIKPRKDPDGWTLGWYNKKDYRRIMTTGRDSRGNSFRRGWLAGIYDAEGSGSRVAQYERVNPTTYGQIARWLEHFGFRVTRGDEYVQILGGKWELLRFYDLVRPALTRKLDTSDMFGGKPHFRFEPDTSFKDRIRSMAPLTEKTWGANRRGTAGKQARLVEVVSIQTETGNYIAAGYASKNCDMKPGQYGGMDDRGSSNVKELNARVATCAHILSYADTHRHLPPKRRVSMYVAPEDQCAERGGFNKELMEAKRRGASAVLEVRLAIAASRKRKAVLSTIEDHLLSNQKVVVFTGRRRDCEELSNDVRKLGVFTKNKDATVFFGHGGMSTESRQTIVDEYMAHPGPAILVGTGDAFGESLNLDTTDAAFFVMLPYTPGQLRQWEGRFHRQSTKKSVLIYYVIAEGSVDDHMASILIDKLPAVADVAKDVELAEAETQLAGIQETTEEEFASSVLSFLDKDTP